MHILIAHRFALVGQALIGLLAGRKPTHSLVPVRRAVWRMTRPVDDVCGATGMLHG
jgi:hypothetical protein